MIARLGAVLCVASCLTACANVGPNDVVRDADSAILKAKQICKWEKPLFPGERWRTAFRDGKWHVWSTEDYGDADEPKWGYQGSAYQDVWIDPRDGTSQGCAVFLD